MEILIKIVFYMFCLTQGFLTGIHLILREIHRSSITSTVHSDILVVNIENQFKGFVIIKNKISTVIYTKSVEPTTRDVKFGGFKWRIFLLTSRKNQSPKTNKFSHAKSRKFGKNIALKVLISKKEEKIFTCISWQSVDIQK